MSQPYLGQPVTTKVDPRTNNGLDQAPALVTAVNLDADDKPESVNLRIFLDTGADLTRKSVEFVTKEPDEDDEDVTNDVSGVQRVAWPVKK